MHNMGKQGLIAAAPMLQFVGRLHGCFFKGGVFFGFPGCRRIDVFQFADRKGSFFWVVAVIGLIKIDQVRLTAL